MKMIERAVHNMQEHAMRMVTAQKEDNEQERVASDRALYVLCDTFDMDIYGIVDRAREFCDDEGIFEENPYKGMTAYEFMDKFSLKGDDDE